MHWLLGQIDATTRLYAVVFGLAVLSLLLAGWLGTHHRRSVIGPTRLQPQDRLSLTWFLAAVGFYSLFLPGVVFQLTRAPEPASTLPSTGPATQLSLSPAASAVLATAQPLTVLLIVAFAGALVWPQWRDRLGLTLRRLPKGITSGLLAAATVIPPMFALAILTQKLWEYVKLDHPKAHALLRAMQADREPVVQGLIVLSAVLLAPIYEELLFRGLLQTATAHTIRRSASDSASRWLAILFTSVIFTLFHPEFWMMPPIFVLSLCLGYVYERTGNLWSCMLVHAAFNASNVILFSLQNAH